MSNEPILELQQGEGKWVKFTVTRDGAALNMSGATKEFGIKKNVLDEDYVYQVENDESGKWDTSQSSDGIIRVSIPASQTLLMDVGEYDAQAKFVITADTDVDKTQKFTIKITPALVTG
jgi:hypothetical protein